MSQIPYTDSEEPESYQMHENPGTNGLEGGFVANGQTRNVNNNFEGRRYKINC